MKDLKVYKHILQDGRIAFTIHESCMEAENLLLHSEVRPVRLVEFKDISEVNNAPQEIGIWRIK